MNKASILLGINSSTSTDSRVEQEIGAVKDASMKDAEKG
jgi:hypothetical protein